MAGIAINGSPTKVGPTRRRGGGRTTRSSAEHAEARSSAGREAVRRDTSRGLRLVTEIFRCRCGRGRQVKREVAAKG